MALAVSVFVLAIAWVWISLSRFTKRFAACMLTLFGIEGPGFRGTQVTALRLRPLMGLLGTFDHRRCRRAMRGWRVIVAALLANRFRRGLDHFVSATSGRLGLGFCVHDTAAGETVVNDGVMSFHDRTSGAADKQKSPGRVQTARPGLP